MHTNFCLIQNQKHSLYINDLIVYVNLSLSIIKSLKYFSRLLFHCSQFVDRITF